MAAATIFGEIYGLDSAISHIYGSWWFSLLWALLTATGIAFIIKSRMKRPPLIMQHLSFMVILLGAFITHLTADYGFVHLRKGVKVSTYYAYTNGNNHSAESHPLPFTITLKYFTTQHHNGTEAASDYVSTFHIDPQNIDGTTSMNNIFSCEGFRLYQSGYDDDGEGTTLSLNHDPYGIPITYTGYALLLISLIWMLLERDGQFRQVLKKASKIAAVLLLFCCYSLKANATSEKPAPTLSYDEAKVFSHLCINYNDRICPVQTFALDFCKTVTGARSFEGFNATQVTGGYMFFAREWADVKAIQVKSSAVREKYGLEEFVSQNQLFPDGEYLFRNEAEQYYRDNQDAFHKEVAKVDEKIMLIMQLQHGGLSRMFPYNGRWYAPTDSIPKSVATDCKEFIKGELNVLASSLNGNQEKSIDIIAQISKYQQRYGGESMPSKFRLSAEHFYNSIPFSTILFMVCLTAGFISLICYRKLSVKIPVAVTLVCFISLTFALALRWIASGTVPMANGYETMLLLAWIIMLVALLLARHFRIMCSFGLILAGFFLLVSHIGQMSPKIGHLMPVLNSPLLSIHVSIVMISYALLSITLLCGIMALVQTETETLTTLSRLMLPLAVAFLSVGIFIGAIWANVSWGRYWGWDPKETWALITMMIYAVPLHRSVKWLQTPRNYHIYMVLAFLSILITYFGVNYFLSGMHSYA